MKVKVIKSGKNTYWYADKVGKVFETRGFNVDDGWFVQPEPGDGFVGKYIEANDCVEVQDEITDRFYLLDPLEREALRVLIQNHLNTISEISLHKEFRVTGYIDWLAKLEEELIHHE